MRIPHSLFSPLQLDGVYQTAQKITVGHLCHHCHQIPIEIREKLLLLKDQKSSDGGGKRYANACVVSRMIAIIKVFLNCIFNFAIFNRYWAEGLRSYQVYETGTDGLALRN